MNKTAIGIEIGASAFRAVVLARRGGRLKVVAAGRHEAPDGLDLAGKLAAAREWLAGLLAAWPRAEVVISLPPGSYLSRIVEFPPATRRPAVAELTRFEAEHEFPIRENELSSGFCVLSAGAESKSVLIACARREAVEAVAAWVRNSGGRLRCITIGAAARLLLFGRNAGRVKSVVTSGNTPDLALLVDLSSERLEIALAHMRSPTVLRSIPIDDVSSDDELRALVAKHCRFALQAGRCKVRGTELKSIQVMGGYEEIERVRDVLQAQFGIPVEVIQPWRECLLSGDAVGIPADSRVPFAFATGLALAALKTSPSLNLASEANILGRAGQSGGPFPGPQ